MAKSLKAAAKQLEKYAASFPEATEDHPWGETVYKVNGKVFVFFGVEQPGQLGCTVKLPESSAFALTFDFTEPAGYGLGRAGWVSSSFDGTTAPPVDILKDWIEESYRAIAPKRLVKQLDAAV